MSGLSNFLGNVYGENNEPNDADAAQDLPPEDQARTESLDDVKESMEALVRGLEESTPDEPEATDEPEHPVDSNPAGVVAPPTVHAEPSASPAVAPSPDDWFAGIDTPPAATEPEQPAADTDAAVPIDPTEDDVQLPDLSSFFSDQSEAESPAQENWFDSLEDPVTEPEPEPHTPSFEIASEPDPEPPAMEAPQEPREHIEPAPQTTPVDPLAVPPPPASLVSDAELAPLDISPPPDPVDTEADPWLEEILAAPAAEVPIAAEPSAPEAPQPRTVTPQRWDPAYDDIIPGRVTAAAALRPIAVDDVVTGALPTETERRRGRRGRRAVDDTVNPVVSEDTKGRRRGRRRSNDPKSVDLPPPTEEHVILDRSLPDPNGVAVTAEATGLDDLTDTLTDDLLAAPPTGDPIEVVPPTSLDETAVSAEPSAELVVEEEPERRRGFMGRRSKDRAPDAVDSDAVSNSEDRKGRRRRSRRGAEEASPEVEMTSDEAADIMGLGPEVTELAPPTEAALDMPAPSVTDGEVNSLPAPDPTAPPAEPAATPPVDLPAPTAGQIIEPPADLGMRVVENPDPELLTAPPIDEQPMRKQSRFRRKG